MVAGFTTTYAIDQFHINRFFVISGLIQKSNRSKIWVVSSLITPDIMEDSRFTAMFKDSDFHIDTTSEEFRLLNPVVSKLDKAKKKRCQARRVSDHVYM
jgi:hypothetical protein